MTSKNPKSLVHSTSRYIAPGRFPDFNICNTLKILIDEYLLRANQRPTFIVLSDIGQYSLLIITLLPTTSQEVHTKIAKAAS